MMLPSALALGFQLFTPAADNVPVLNVEPVCQGIAVQGGSSFQDPAVGKEKQDCIRSENEVRQDLVKQWSSFSAADRAACVSEATMGGDSSYTELLTCLEMARDVRSLGKETNGTAIAPRSAKPRR